MAKFYGVLQGARGEATRLGHSGIKTIAASWKGAVEVNLSERNGKTIARVDLVPWRGVGVKRTIFEGAVDSQD